MWHDATTGFGQYFAVDNVLYHEKPSASLIIFESLPLLAHDGAERRGTDHGTRRVYLS